MWISMLNSHDPELVDLSLIEDFPEEFPVERRNKPVRGSRTFTPDAREIGRAIASQAHHALTEKVMREYSAEHRNL